MPWSADVCANADADEVWEVNEAEDIPCLSLARRFELGATPTSGLIPFAYKSFRARSVSLRQSESQHGISKGSATMYKSKDTHHSSLRT